VTVERGGPAIGVDLRRRRQHRIGVVVEHHVEIAICVDDNVGSTEPEVHPGDEPQRVLVGAAIRRVRVRREHVQGRCAVDSGVVATGHQHREMDVLLGGPV
jgi:hypothetical protein